MPRSIPYVNLGAQYQSLKSEIDSAAARVLASGRYVLGEEVEAFEREFAAYCGTQYAVAVNSGTSALHLSLLALGVGPGDEVITTPLTFVATAAAILYTGAKPVFVDVEPATCTIDPELVARAITPRTKAILPVHLYGQPADMRPLVELAKRHGLAIVEDACQAHGALYDGRRVGTMGEVGCFSFYPTKPLGGVGEGGMVVTNRFEHYGPIRTLRDWGAERRYRHRQVGYNYRMDAVQAAVLRAKLPYLDEWNAARRRLAREYETLESPDVDLPVEAAGRQHVYHIYSIRSERRDALQAALEAVEIETAIHYPIPVHLQEGYVKLGSKLGDFPVVEQVARTSLSLPLYAGLEPEDIKRVVEICRAAFSRYELQPER